MMASILRLWCRRLVSYPVQYPLRFGVVVSCGKTGFADYIAQMKVEQRSQLDYRRSAVFLAWGALYLGGVQYFIYVHLFSRILFPSAASFVAKPLTARMADRAGQAIVLQQVALDQFVHHPFMLFPCFYCVKEFIEQGTIRASLLTVALKKWRANFWEDCQVCWSTWIPAFLVNFSFCPIWARIPFVATVSMGFTVYFSYLRGDKQALKATQSKDVP